MTIHKIFKRKKTYIWSVIIIFIILGGYFMFRTKSAVIKTVTAQIGDIVQVISATGQISAGDKVDLSFDHSGKISGVYSQVGSPVFAGQILARLDSADLSAQLQSANASVMTAQAKYDQLINGPRAEDVKVLQTSLDNAQNILNDAKTKSALVVVKTALNSALNSLVIVSDQFSKYKTNLDNSAADKILNGKEISLFKIYGQNGLRQTEPWSFLSLHSGLAQEISEYDLNSGSVDGVRLLNDINQVLFETQNCVDLTYAALNMPMVSESDKTLVVSAKNNLLIQISAVAGQQQMITTAQNNVDNLRSQLNLKTAPPTQYDIDISQAQLIQAKAGLAQIQAQMEKNLLRSPISGILANIDLKPGEIASPAQVAAIIIGKSKFRIEANIPEADVAKIKINDPATITLDAYGQDVVWNAVVTQIYPTEKVIDGVPTYKTIISFSHPDDRIRSGMTANLDIQNDKRENALFLPQRSVIRRDGKKFVKIKLPENYASDSRFANISVNTETDKVKTAEIEIQTGLYGSDGRVEILSGVKEGDLIITE